MLQSPIEQEDGEDDLSADEYLADFKDEERNKTVFKLGMSYQNWRKKAEIEKGRAVWYRVAANGPNTVVDDGETCKKLLKWVKRSQKVTLELVNRQTDSQLP